MPVATTVIAALLAAAPATSTTTAPVAPAGHCDASYGLHRADTAAATRFRLLGDLPPADLILTVYREIDRCPAPIIVRANIGAPAPAIPPPDRPSRR